MALAGMLYTRRRQVRVEAMTEIEPGRILLALYGVAFGRMVLMAALFVVAFAGAGLTPVPLLVGFALVQVVSLLRGHRGRKQDSD